MKIRTKSAGALALLAVASLATSCATDVETSVNTDPEGNAIRFAASVGRSARATETKLDNLGDFAVVARGMHPDGVLYDQYIIGASGGGDIAKKVSGPTNTWKLDHDVYWPAALQRILFVGYTTLQSGESSDGGAVLSGANFRIDGNVPEINSFEPKKADLSKGSNAGDGIWADGKDQKDLVVAFNAMDRGSSTAVSLNFRHALTQVSIQAGMKDKEPTDHRRVKVKGAWIVNAAQSGALSATITVDTEDKATYPTTNTTSWSSSVDLETYGSYYNDVIPLQRDGNDGLLRESLMLIPQSLTAWDHKNPSVTTGAYIMLLCRVELEHDGETHSGSAGKDIAFKDGKHYHQLFPVNTEKYDGSEYGFVCVPLGTDWGDPGSPDTKGSTTTTDLKGMGKHYTYKLDICGKESGAGYYPPTPDPSKLIPTGATVTALVLQDDGTYKEENVTLNPKTDRPSSKNIGDPVLDDPIKFTVTVSEWDDLSKNSEWTDGNGNLKM